MASISQFVIELRRRNVFRTGVAYLVVAWLLIQVADILLDTFPAPAWVMRAVVVALAAGFPVALILAWIYEITTQGVKRTKQVSEGESVSVHSGRQIDFVIIGVLTVAVALFAADRFQWIDFGTAPSIDIRSIAVLPLHNLSGEPEQAYFVNGMTDALIAELSKISALRVISRQSVMQFEDSIESLPEIAKKLNVDTIVEGSALLIEDEVRITVQLIEAETDVHLWADSYDRDIRNVLALHSEVARTIAHEIQIAVTPEEAVRLTNVREVNPEAYRLYLLGQHHNQHWSPEELEKAIGYFQRAIAIDPQYAEAYVGLSYSYGAIAFYGFDAPQEVMDQSGAAMARALAIDNDLAIAHQSYAGALFYFEWNWKKAEEEFQRAISLNPNYFEAHQLYAWFLAAMRCPEQALRSISLALELNPLALWAYITASDVHYFSRQYDQAIAQLRELLGLSPDHDYAHSRLGWSYLQKGMFAEAINELERAVTLFPDNPEHRWMLGHAYAQAGETAEARKILDDLHSLANDRYVLPYGFALIHTGLGESDEALEWLEKAYQDRNGWMPFLQVEPRFDALRSDPRFQDLLRRMNLAE